MDNNFDKLLAREVRWLRNHRGESGKSKDYERGFEKGLQHARWLLQQASKKKETE